MSQTIFLSTTTGEFGPVRKRLAAVCDRTKRLHVRHQDDFVHRGTLTLHTLEEEVRDSTVVVHLIGADFGSAPPRDQVDDLLKRLPDFETKFAEVAAAARQGEVSYTQWEAWLALYFRSGSDMRLCSYETVDSREQRHPLQAAHLERLQKRKIYPNVVPAGRDLGDEIMLSLIALGLLTEEESRTIVHLPYPSIGTLFKGRDAFLDELRQSLQRTIGGNGQATAITGRAVHGLGGVGKTRLAVEYAWQHSDQYSAVLFVTADSPENLRQNLAALSGPLVLNLPEQTAPEEEVRVAAALRWLHEHPGWFLILDNVDTEASFQYAEELLPRLHGGQVLITSRLGKWSGAVEPLELDVLDTTAAASFLLERTQPKTPSGRGRRVGPADEASATALAKDLDGLALALEQASAFICQKRISLGEYLTRWLSHAAEVQKWHDSTMKYPKSVAITWQTTLDQLAPDAVVLLNILAWLAPEPIPLAILEHLELESLASLRSCCLQPSAAGSPETATETAKEGAPDSIDVRDLLSHLADFGMLRWDAQADSITVHRVVQDILRTRQTEPIPVLTAALTMLNRARPEGGADDVRTWPEWNALRPHVAFAVGAADVRDIAEPTTRLMGELGTLLWAKALHAEAEQLERRALAIDEKAFGPNSPQVALRLNNLAVTLQATNRLAEAEPLMRRALAIDEQSYGIDHPNVAIRLNNLAQLLQATNRLAEAEPLMRRALAIGEQSFGPEHPNVAIRLNNLALLLQATNRLVEAEPLMRRALAIDEQAYGADHPEVATDLNNLASLLHATNRLAEAEPLMRRVLTIVEKSLGEDHPNVATALNNLAQLLKATNRLAEAEPLMRRALAIDEQSYGAEHPNVAIRLNNLAGLLHATNRLAEAEPLMRRALAITADFKRRTGYEHPEFGSRVENYRSILSQMDLPPDEIDRRVRDVCGE